MSPSSWKGGTLELANNVFLHCCAYGTVIFIVKHLHCCCCWLQVCVYSYAHIGKSFASDLDMWVDIDVLQSCTIFYSMLLLPPPPRLRSHTTVKALKASLCYKRDDNVVHYKLGESKMDTQSRTLYRKTDGTHTKSHDTKSSEKWVKKLKWFVFVKDYNLLYILFLLCMWRPMKT